MAFFDTLCSFLSQGLTSGNSMGSGTLGNIVNAGINAFGGKQSHSRNSGVGGLIGGLVGGFIAKNGGNMSNGGKQYQQYNQQQYQSAGNFQQNQQYQQNIQNQQYQQQYQQQMQQPQQRQFDNVFGTQQNINDFLLLIVKVGVYVACCDQNFTSEEKYKIDDYIARLNGISTISNTVKNQIQNIYHQTFTFDDITLEMNALLSNYQSEQDKAEIKGYVNEFIDDLTFADGNTDNSENEFVVAWRSRFA